MKGIILAGGKATRLYPVTKGISKQLLPVYNKPMIYYPLSVLMLAGIREILIITAPESLGQFKNLLGDGSDYGLRLSYALQEKPKGIADAFIIAEQFIGKECVCLVLGDNIFFGDRLSAAVRQAASLKEGAMVFAYNVNDPQHYGVVEFDKNKQVISIEEKPKKPRSSWAVTGLYFYDNAVIRLAKGIKPSRRGELEITDINNAYLKKKKLKVMNLGRGYAWLDTGNYDSLLEASLFIKTVENRQGLKIACIEEIAYNMGYISKKDLLRLAEGIKTSYGEYLRQVAEGII